MKLLTPMFITLTIASLAAFATIVPTDHHHDENAQSAKKPITLNVYALDTCPVSGQKLRSMGDPVVKEYDGREVRFCCAGCVEPFEKDRQKFINKIDAQLVERQKAHYPLKQCIVSGRSLEESETAIDMIHEGRLVRFCCPGCPGRFKENPDRYMVKLDKAIIAQQREKYPLDTCIVAGMKLGSMGEPHEVIVGGSLVRFCCAGCVGGFKKDPAKHLAAIREAWIKQHEKAGEEH